MYPCNFILIFKQYFLFPLFYFILICEGQFKSIKTETCIAFCFFLNSYRRKNKLQEPPVNNSKDETEQQVCQPTFSWKIFIFSSIQLITALKYVLKKCLCTVIRMFILIKHKITKIYLKGKKKLYIIGWLCLCYWASMQIKMFSFTLLKLSLKHEIRYVVVVFFLQQCSAKHLDQPLIQAGDAEKKADTKVDEALAEAAENLCKLIIAHEVKSHAQSTCGCLNMFYEIGQP